MLYFITTHSKLIDRRVGNGRCLMEWLSRKTKKRIALFLAVFVIAFILDILPPTKKLFRYSSSLTYGSLIIAWALTIYRRMVNRRIKRYLIAAAAFLWALFPIRISRWAFFTHSDNTGRYLWYLYYVPFIAVPLISLCISCCVGSDERDRNNRGLFILHIPALILIAGIMTNDLHSAAFSFFMREGELAADHKWLYYIIVVWAVSLTVSSFIILIKRCRISKSRKYWYVPLIPLTVGLVLNGIYLICGGAPRIGGLRLYNVQELYGIMFIGMWEGCIQIGLIPSNTGYTELFELSHVNAALWSKSGAEVYRSANFTDNDENENHIPRYKNIIGGTVKWTEDMTAVRRMNAELEDAAELIRSENELLEEEIRFRAEKTAYETKNRLYDRIAQHVHTQLVELDEALKDTDSFDLRMKFCLILGTYVKRSANLMLIAGDAPEMSAQELALSVCETLEYLSFLGIDCELDDRSAGIVPSVQVIAAYDLFEAVIESALDKITVCSVRICEDSDSLITIEADIPKPVFGGSFKPRALSALGMELLQSSAEGLSLTALKRGGDSYEKL